MEYATKGDLHHYIVERGRLSVEEARRIFQQVDYIHICVVCIYIYIIMGYVSDYIWCGILTC